MTLDAVDLIELATTGVEGVPTQACPRSTTTSKVTAWQPGRLRAAPPSTLLSTAYEVFSDIVTRRLCKGLHSSILYHESANVGLARVASMRLLVGT